MTESEENLRLAAFLDGAYRAEERMSSGDLQRRAIAEDLPASLLTRVDALPEGEYLQDEAAEALSAPAI
ncbi:hypothetical protein ACWT_1155 [Actinoplanes sp. SE50]|uniref:hypothetical protein n=1 Tax=unclassified Actinoplanes TaxID=2626549 RepID=UPI00023ED19E|nr:MULTISPECIES: hypothetical protein [unclassified Actinoplanes]AEV82171.1 hypothetical protein ACPL_1274 [Actinoplanes sp. SE50/110]ATO80570.1 hypothetical protein ACWT_1155 [Actinoplanes sp. SE50]SLL97976.1 hypothetical protein ACSP50_1192 [Actinoplanes sp. SE50/110]